MNNNIPKLSIVIATHNAAHVIEQCLTALQNQERSHEAEIIVADSSSDGTDDIIKDRFPNVRLLHFSEPLTVPRLRGEAIAVIRGEIIAILDPFSIADTKWQEELLKAHEEQPHWAIGGAVELFDADKDSMVNWANYINEYGGFLLPMKAGAVNILPGSNISYKRQALENIEDIRQHGFWKAFANWKLEAGNRPLWLAPSVIVYLHKPLSFSDFFRTRYHHGRCYAAMRVADKPGHVRWLRALTVPLLPALFMWRLANDFWPKQRHRKEFILALPLLCLLFISWAWGELWGYLFGCGHSCRQLFY